MVVRNKVGRTSFVA